MFKRLKFLLQPFENICSEKVLDELRKSFKKGFYVKVPIKVKLTCGKLAGRMERSLRLLSDMEVLFKDKEAFKSINGNRIVYEVYRGTVNGLGAGLTVIYPGKVGEEFHMTKGHVHVEKSHSEIYLGLTGLGLTMLQNRDTGETYIAPLEGGILVWVKGMYAHRSINIYREKLTFLSFYPSNSKVDYEFVLKKGFKLRVIERNSKVDVIEA